MERYGLDIRGFAIVFGALAVSWITLQIIDAIKRRRARKRKL